MSYFQCESNLIIPARPLFRKLSLFLRKMSVMFVKVWRKYFFDLDFVGKNNVSFASISKTKCAHIKIKQT